MLLHCLNILEHLPTDCAGNHRFQLIVVLSHVLFKKVLAAVDFGTDLADGIAGILMESTNVMGQDVAQSKGLTTSTANVLFILRSNVGNHVPF